MAQPVRIGVEEQALDPVIGHGRERRAGWPHARPSATRWVPVLPLAPRMRRMLLSTGQAPAV
jgi:hypothetical protein